MVDLNHDALVGGVGQLCCVEIFVGVYRISFRTLNDKNTLFVVASGSADGIDEYLFVFDKAVCHVGYSK